MEYLDSLGKRAKDASVRLNVLDAASKNLGLRAAAQALVKESASIIEANRLDMEEAVANGMSDALQDRLMLNEDRIKAMAEGLEQISAMKDPIGEVMENNIRPNGLKIMKVRVPMGVIGIIYESRPNVTADAFGLCFKTGNAVILRGGSDSINSNKEIVNVIRKALENEKLPEDALLLVEDTSRQTATEFMKMNDYMDLLIPRGGAGLIHSVVSNATVPVIETGTGNCHIYVDEEADIDMALDIIDNAKTSRMGVCNACESLVIHKAVAGDIIPRIYERLTGKNVEIRGSREAIEISPGIKPASDEDFAKEFLGPFISMKVVDNLDQAIEHVNANSTHHSEAIITKNRQNAERFMREVDAACVYMNASTRFTDGGEFGLGAEIGISTQKFHARGPMGLEAITSYKYEIYGDGQIRT
ncbi:MAG: glutamate-5-semialdehyde dehydrogenase [Lachnospiraceae bacterium]|nr:glutamate-5-semialdehyde dehydrogenase [Lachnospiraceae bacterium]